MTIAFRVSPEENQEINNRVKLAGYRVKQKYICDCLLEHRIIAKGNPLMLVTFRKNLAAIENELVRLNPGDPIGEEMLTRIVDMQNILDAFLELKKPLN